VRTKLVAVAALAVLTSLGVVAQPHPDSARAVTGADVQVGSFNIQSVSLDKTVGNQRPWKTRRAGVVADILGEKLDVVGIQEANPSRFWASHLVSGTNQYQDLKNGLNAAGGHYRLTNAYPYNCVNYVTSYKCVYKSYKASGGVRILYSTDTLSLVSQGSTKFTVQGSGADPRFLAWAVLRVKATGHDFLFVNTHLRTGDSAVLRAQWTQLITRVNQLKGTGTRPVVVVGDFNTHRNSPLAKEMLPAMQAAGYGDVRNQVYAQNPIRSPRAQSSVNGWVNTSNRLDRNLRNWSYPDARTKAGYNIDWVFATNSVPVKQWKNVVDYYPTTLQVKGVFPSDHDMVRATLTLP